MRDMFELDDFYKKLGCVEDDGTCDGCKHYCEKPDNIWGLSECDYCRRNFVFACDGLPICEE